MNDRIRWLKNLAVARTLGYKVILVPTSALKDYAAMNDEAGRKIGFRYKGKKLPDKTILIDRNMSVKTKLRDLKHEIIEMNLMEKRHMKYWPAHLIATRRENK